MSRIPIKDNMMEIQVLFWIFFNLFVLVMLILDLGVFHKKNHEIKLKEALIWSVIWIGLALLFNLVLYLWKEDTEYALNFLAAYFIEKSLSVDNIFVFVLIFSYFNVNPIYHHKILFWGIIGALVMRIIFIFAGIALIKMFHWIIYVFGLFLILTGIKMFFSKEKEIHPEKNIIFKLSKRIFPLSNEHSEGKFFIRDAETKKLFATPLFVVLLMIESSDLIFAVDSIPAVLAISNDPFLVYTSNVFAILGLRSLYFAIASIVKMFKYLHYGLSVILCFVGVKMLLSDIFKIPIGIALGVIVLILLFSILFSLKGVGKIKVNNSEISS